MSRDPIRLARAAHQLASRSISKVTRIIRGTRGAADDMAKAAASPSKLRKFLTGGGLLGGGAGTLGFLANALLGGSGGSGRGRKPGAAIDTGDLEGGAVRGQDATSRSSVVLVDFESMIKNVPPQVKQLSDVQMNVNFGETTFFTTDNLAIKYDIEEMFDKEQGELVIPELTKISVTSPEIDGIQRALLRTAANLQLLNTQIGEVNSRLDSFEKAIKDADDRNRRALLEAERQADEDEAESSNKKKGLIATNIERAKEAVKTGLQVIATSLLGAALGAVAYYLGDGLEKFTDDDESNDEDAQDSVAIGTTLGAAIATGTARTVQNRRGIRSRRLAREAVDAIPGVSDDVARVAAQSGLIEARKAAAAEVSEALFRAGEQETSEVIAKKASVEAISEAIERIGPRLAAAGAGKSIPIVGSLVGAGFTVAKLWQGDYVGAAIEAGATAVSFTGVGGPLLGPAITAGIIAREVYGIVYKDENGDPIYPEEDAYRATRLPEIVNATSEWMKDQLQSEADKLPGGRPRPRTRTRTWQRDESEQSERLTGGRPRPRTHNRTENDTNIDSVPATNMDNFDSFADLGRSRFSQSSDDLRDLSARATRLASEMGLNPDSELSIEHIDEVPIEINGVTVPPVLYTPDEIERIQQFRVANEIFGRDDPAPWLDDYLPTLELSPPPPDDTDFGDPALQTEEGNPQAIVIPLVVPTSGRRAPQPISARSGEGPIPRVEDPFPHRITSDSYNQVINMT